MKNNINETIVEYNRVKKYFPNIYNSVMKYLNRPASKEFFYSDSAPNLKTYIEFEGIFQLLFYLKDNLKKGSKLSNILNKYRNRILNSELNSCKSFYKFTDGYLYEHASSDFEFASDMFTQSLILVSSIKLFFEDKYNSEHAPIIALAKINSILDYIQKKKDKCEQPLSSYEYFELCLVKSTNSSTSLSL